jgi:hypothetical protein
MRSLGALATLLCLATSASAGVTAGVSAGLTHPDQDSGSDANHTLGVFGRLGFTHRVSGQAELEKVDANNSNVDIRTITGVLVVDLGDHGPWMPMLVAGIGFDHATMQYASGSVDGHHIEGGFSLEYRADGGFTVGAGVRLGGRTIDSDTTVTPYLRNVALYVPQTITDGEYRSGQIYAAVRF